MSRSNSRSEPESPSASPSRPSLAQTFAITGATGYLGSRLARRLHEAGHRVIVLKRSTSDVRRIADLLPLLSSFDIDREPLDTPFANYSCTCVLHCATDYGRKSVSSASIIEANLLLPLRLLETAVEHGTPFFVNTDTVLDKRINDYSLSKRQFREWLEALAGSIQGINIALEHFYGPGDDRTKFVGEMVARMLRGDRSISLTPGEQLRDFIHIDDVVDAFMCILAHHVATRSSTPSQTSSPGSVINYEVGSGQPISIRRFMTLLHQIAARADVSLDFGAIPYRPNEVMHSRAQVAPLMKLGWMPRVSLEDGLRQTIAHEKMHPWGEPS